ncbi:MAG: HTH domain-containing protein [Clostridia bacterium]|nr:HTH domain-containing protein [Clostridia bacterium]
MQDLSPSERRADILRNLQINRFVTAETLADEYGVSKATIYRDMLILFSDYEGIVPLQGHEGGYLCDYRYFPRQHI